MTNNEWIDKAKDLAEQGLDYAKDNPDQVRGAIDSVGDFVNDKTGGKFSEQIDQASEWVEGQLGANEAPAEKPEAAAPEAPAAPAAAEPAPAAEPAASSYDSAQPSGGFESSTDSAGPSYGSDQQQPLQQQQPFEQSSNGQQDQSQQQ